MVTPINISTQLLDKDANSFYNTGCYSEIEKIVRQCSEFQTLIADKVSFQIKLGLIMLLVLILFKVFIEYNKPKFSQTEMFKSIVSYRLDLAIIITLFCVIALFFM
jgi:uncharacterized membrane protein (DUF485 family)